MAASTNLSHQLQYNHIANRIFPLNLQTKKSITVTPATKFLPQLLQLCHRRLVRLVRDCHAHLRTWNQSTIAPNSYNSVSGVCRWCPVSWAAHLKTHLINSNSSISNHKSAHVFSDSFALLWSAVSMTGKGLHKCKTATRRWCTCLSASRRP